MQLAKKDILDMASLSPEEIDLILDTAAGMKEISTRPIKKVPTLRGKTVVLLFFEPSTRTRISFELAAKRLSADTINISAASSSVQKGESLIDTGKTLEAMKSDFVVMRHGMSGASHLLSRTINSGIINAGDGFHEHPTQGLLDMFTIREKKGRIEGLKVVIIGDILHSRVARSDVWGLVKLGAEVVLCGPPTFLPAGIEKTGAKVTHDMNKALKGADVVNTLRIQMERQKENLLPSLREYNLLYGMNGRKLKLAGKNTLILHPGPMNRGIEITSGVADSSRSAINEQVTNGIAVRMAVLYLLAGSGRRG